MNVVYLLLERAAFSSKPRRHCDIGICLWLWDGRFVVLCACMSVIGGSFASVSRFHFLASLPIVRRRFWRGRQKASDEKEVSPKSKTQNIAPSCGHLVLLFCYAYATYKALLSLVRTSGVCIWTSSRLSCAVRVAHSINSCFFERRNGRLWKHRHVQHGRRNIFH